MKNYYELLQVAATASPDEVKRAFRTQIARYHPDKVHHLGNEFQEIAATRAAELTEAYRVLSHEGRRADYDAQLKTPPAGAADPAAAAQPERPPSSTPPGTASKSEAAETAAKAETVGHGKQFVEERASRDAFVRKAALERFRQALLQVAGAAYTEEPIRGFDMSCVPKPTMFARSKGPWLLGRYVPRVDGPSIIEAWTLVGRLKPAASDDLCVILMGTQLAPPRELADAIIRRRRPPAHEGKVTLIPVNASVWDAHMPIDAPDVAKKLLTRLRSGA